VIHPTHATHNFTRRVPVWGPLTAQLEGERPVAGLVSAPALGRRWWGALGHGSYAGKHQRAATRISVSAVRRIEDASFCYASLPSWEEAGRLEPMLQIMRDSWRSRAYGDFYGYMLLAEGAVDVMVEPELSLWDVAALIPIVTEAGGMFTDLAGERAPGGGSAIATNGHLHREILGRLAAGAPLTHR
jgi:histidinol-phosphatase